MNAQENKSFHDFIVKDIYGNEFALSQMKGKKVLVVNTASRCGYTPQYEDLEKLFNEYGGENFQIIGFPANNFFRQEPGSDERIEAFCKRKYDISFPMMSKISVKCKNIHPLYQWLASKEENGVMDTHVKWNFQKYMIDEEGQLAGFADPKEKPYSEKILNWIKE